MLNNKQILIVAVCLIPITCMAQDTQQEKKGHYELVKSADGVMSRIFVADDPALAMTILRMKTAAEVQHLSKQGIDEILNLLTAEKMNAISDVELADYQKVQLGEVQSAYQKELRTTNVRDSDSFNSLRVKYGRKIEKILLPEQLVSIAKKTNLKNKRILSLLVYPKLAERIEFTESQQKLLKAECEKANQKIKQAIKEMEEQTEKCRQEIRAVLDRVLTAEQKESFLRIVDADLVQEMNLPDMDQDTNLGSSKK